MAFLHKENGKWNAQVVLHGLERETGLSRDRMEKALNDGTFWRRIVKEDRAAVKKLIVDSDYRIDTFTPPFRFTGVKGSELRLVLSVEPVQETNCGVEKMLMLRRVAEEEDT